MARGRRKGDRAADGDAVTGGLEVVLPEAGTVPAADGGRRGRRGKSAGAKAEGKRGGKAGSKGRGGRRGKAAGGGGRRGPGRAGLLDRLTVLVAVLFLVAVAVEQVPVR